MLKKSKNQIALLALIVISILIFSPSAHAEMFDSLTTKGAELFTNMRDIVYIVAGFGLIGIAVGGIFGQINWKWLVALAIGLMVLASAGALIKFIVGDDAPSVDKITDTLTY